MGEGFALRSGRPVVVVGSLNMDLVMRSARVPVAGETLNGHGFATMPGGKGANQALACARLGATVQMIGRVGRDAFGEALRRGLAQDGIDVSAVLEQSDAVSGVAMILVEDSGQNRIILAPGANASLGAAELDAEAARIAAAALLVLQLEVPMPAVVRAIAHARAASVPVLLNPAPAFELPSSLWPAIDILVPNESEAQALTGVTVTDPASAFQAGRVLRAKGVGCVLITLGAQGVAIVDAQGERHMAARAVRAVDTTAAGDTFIGGLVAGLLEGRSLDAAAALGQAASAICVTRAGAQPSIPYRRELSL
ncbi:ribokinase [Niveibacterium sp. SC-1]|uniref:ribokinase n=1 Tax=Niveibacterium sp. SC-1 TaxID=3135646 RepID=UPI00311DFBDE